jgi:hypothetical protein
VLGRSLVLLRPVHLHARGVLDLRGFFDPSMPLPLAPCRIE